MKLYIRYIKKSQQIYLYKYVQIAKIYIENHIKIKKYMTKFVNNQKIEKINFGGNIGEKISDIKV